mmetsp:Transcript_7174/g.21880  ORF Transcript_7174/g.21880 Transcript_7174/m.21880 type:complete len:116 (+) Transcript_7174:180-527(+)
MSLMLASFVSAKNRCFHMDSTRWLHTQFQQEPKVVVLAIKTPPRGRRNPQDQLQIAEVGTKTEHEAAVDVEDVDLCLRSGGPKQLLHIQAERWFPICVVLLQGWHRKKANYTVHT